MSFSGSDDILFDNTTGQAIIHYCQYQERCHSEVRNKLYALGANREEADQYITGLIERNLLNEERFALAIARGKFLMKQWGRIKIRQQLRQKGISDYCIRKALDSIDGDMYLEQLRRLAEKKDKELTGKNPHIRKAGLFRYLLQKGYEGDLISLVLNAER